MGGGDGTISAGAGALAGGPKPLGVLPLGTLQPLRAGPRASRSTSRRRCAMIAAGHVRRGGRGRGERPRVPQQLLDRRLSGHGRGTARAASSRGMRKGPAMMPACRQLRRFPFRGATLRARGRDRRVTTPLVFIGNNRYEMSSSAWGAAKRWTRPAVALRGAQRRRSGIAAPGRCGRCWGGSSRTQRLRDPRRARAGGATRRRRAAGGRGRRGAAAWRRRCACASGRGPCACWPRPRIRPGVRTIAHLSDLHFGREDPRVVEALAARPAALGRRRWSW